ncbi:MAG TPA: lipocalin-like domain-containing protein [Polyangiaceae bacterium]|nr:lipocalin-like domain-containing protein [Polyangiaceae bacterium]
MRARSAISLAGLAVLVATVGIWRAEPRPASARPILTVLKALGPGAHDDGFARVMLPREFHFPADHGPHPEFRNEWWYWTGNLRTPDGRAFGFELTIFRTALAPDQDPHRASAWAPRDIYMAHFTISDIDAARFYAFERTSRSALELAGATVAPWRMWVLDWSALGPDDAQNALPLHLRAAEGDVSLDLSLEQGKPTVLQGDRGLSRKGPEADNASYYYSLTRMPTSGAITVGGERFEVRGESWMDREWSTRALSSEQTGWNWFALRLDDGRELMFFQLLRRDGQKDAWSSGSLVDRDGTAHPLRADDVTVEPLGTWTSPHSHTDYPAAFRLAVPGAALDLRVLPLLADQELDLTFRYWEGAVRVEGSASGHAAKGLGYLELTGYGDEARQPR